MARLDKRMADRSVVFNITIVVWIVSSRIKSVGWCVIRVGYWIFYYHLFISIHHVHEPFYSPQY